MTWNNGRVGQDRQPGYGFGLRSQGDFDPRTDLAILAGSIPSFLHVAGDGNTPTIGPPLTTTGTITEGSPIVLASGGALRTDAYTGVNYRSAGPGPLVPILGDTDDLVFAICLDIVNNASNQCFFCIANPAIISKAWAPHVPALSTAFNVNLIANTLVALTVATTAGAKLAVLRVNRDGLSRAMLAPGTYHEAASPVGKMVDATPSLAMGRIPNTLQPYTGRIAWCALWQGAGIADLWTAARIAQLYALAGVA